MKPVHAAIIYCRVSSQKQELDGDGNRSQEHLCRAHATKLGVSVEAVYTDSKSGYGDYMERPGMVRVLEHLKKHRSKRYVVIFDDLKRFARRTRFYWELRDRLASFNASVDSPNFRFEDSPEGRHHETITVAGGELEREQLRRQAIQKMTARVERGYAVTSAPVGYEYRSVKRSGRVLFPKEPEASIVREALEGYACGRFESQAEVQRFLESRPEFPRDRKGRVHNPRVTEMLKRAIYAGLVSAPYWNVSLRQGVHEGLISVETFNTIQDRLAGKKRAPARADFNPDFPLRGFVACTCGTMLTAGWTKGRERHYPYYFCYNRGCPHYGRSIKRDALEGKFAVIMSSVQPPAGVFRAARQMFEDAWNARIAASDTDAKALQTTLSSADRQIQQLLDRVVDTESAAVAKAYEERIERLQAEKLAIAEKLQNMDKPKLNFESAVRTAMNFLENPMKLWSSERVEQKRLALRLTFAQHLEFDRETGFRTAHLSLPFKALAATSEPFLGPIQAMVGAAGIEPATPPV
jgi:site-specific DNA recombinase